MRMLFYGGGGTRVYGLANGAVVNDSESGGEVEVDDGDFGSPGGGVWRTRQRRPSIMRRGRGVVIRVFTFLLGLACEEDLKILDPTWPLIL